MAKFEIRNRWTGAIIFECDAESMRLCVELAIQKRVSLSAADLRAANLSAADLRAANLSAADLRAANLSAANLRAANLRDADLSDANLSDADLSDANLSDANLRAANLRAANLRDADLSDAKEDFLQKLSKAKHEAIGLYKALMDGKIDGSCYEGECACFCGTIANVKGINYQKLAEEVGIVPDGQSPVEKWFYGIHRGDTPENNPISAITQDWMHEFFQKHDLPTPRREVIWK